MEGDKEILEERIKKGFSISISQVLNDVIRVFGKGAGSYISLMLVLTIVFFALGMTALISIDFLIISSIAVVVLVVPVVQVGVARFAKNQMESRPSAFTDFIIGTKYNYQQLVLQAIIILVINLAVTILPDMGYYSDYFSMIRMGLDDPESFLELFLEFSAAHADRGILSFFVGIFSFYISLGLSLTPYIITFYNVNAFTAMDVSFRTINKIVFRAAAINIILSIIMGVGFVFFLVGGLATVPMLLIGSYLVFRHTLGDKDKDTRTNVDIDDHLIE